MPGHMPAEVSLPRTVEGTEVAEHEALAGVLGHVLAVVMSVLRDEGAVLATQQLLRTVFQQVVLEGLLETRRVVAVCTGVGFLGVFEDVTLVQVLTDGRVATVLTSEGVFVIVLHEVSLVFLLVSRA